MDCNAEGSDRETQEMVFGEVIQLWKEGRGKGLYIKDWHLARNVQNRSSSFTKGGEETFYETPDIFKDDWMNHYYSHKTEDDFKFVYFGTAGTTTALHRDVCTLFLHLYFSRVYEADVECDDRHLVLLVRQYPRQEALAFHSTFRDPILSYRSF